MPLVLFFFKTVYAVFPDPLLNCGIFHFSWRNGCEQCSGSVTFWYGSRSFGRQSCRVTMFLNKRLWWGPMRIQYNTITTSSLRLQLLSFSFRRGLRDRAMWDYGDRVRLPARQEVQLQVWQDGLDYLVQSRVQNKNPLKKSSNSKFWREGFWFSVNWKH